MPDVTRTLHQRWQQQLEGIDLEMAREAIICGVRLFDAGVADRVLQGDAGVCRHRNQAAFGKLRALLVMHFAVHQRASVALGGPAMHVMGGEIRLHLSGRIRGQLGTWEH